MAGNSGFSISIRAVDQTSGTLDSVNKRLARLAAPAERFNKALSKFGETTGISRVTEGVRGLGAGAADAFRSLDRMASPLAAITSVTSLAGMAALTRRWAEFGNQISQTSYRLNMPVEKLGSLRGAMRLAGGSASDLDSGLAGLDERLRGAAFGRDPAAIQAFQSLNIGFGDAEHGARKASDALGDIAESLQGKTPGAQHKILESLGLNDSFLPLLKNGRKGLEEFEAQAEKTGGVMTGQMVQNATEMNKAWQRLGLDFEGVGNRMVDSWSGTVTKVLENSSKWIENNKATADSITAIGGAVTGLTMLKPAAWVLRLLGLGALVDAAPAIALGGGLLAAGGLAGSAEAPMVDEYGRVIGNWGGRDETANPAYRNPLGTPSTSGGWRGQHAPSWLGGGSAASEISAPRAPSAAAGTMQRAHNYFRDKGLSEEQTAGILSNIAAESHFDPNVSVNDGGKEAYGLFQHRDTRLAAMRSRYRTMAPTERQQLDFAWDELNGPERPTLERLRSVNTPGQAGAVFTGFERPADGKGEAFRRGQAAGQFVQHDETPLLKPADHSPGTFAQTVPESPNGKVHVEVTLKNAPAGTTSKVTSSGAVTAPPARIETPFPMVN